MMLKVDVCRLKHGIMTRIIKGLPACILPGGEVVHNDKGCCGCRYETEVELKSITIRGIKLPSGTPVP